MNRLRLSTGHEIPLDGDLLAVLEALYDELTLKRQFKGTFEDMMREIGSLVDQMSPEDQRRYLVESLFLNYNTFESEMLDAYARRLTDKNKKKLRGRAAGGAR
jgi:predicted DNA-binding helix-hairpin-helix protein